MLLYGRVQTFDVHGCRVVYGIAHSAIIAAFKRVFLKTHRSVSVACYNMTTEQRMAKLKPLLQSAFNALSCSNVISNASYGPFRKSGHILY